MVLRPWHARVGELHRAAPGTAAVPRHPRRHAVGVVAPRDRGRCSSLRPERVSVVRPGVDARFSPGGTRSPQPLVLAVGRLVPVKRFDLLMDVLAEVRRPVPDLRAVIVGEGYERARLEAHRRAARGRGVDRAARAHGRRRAPRPVPAGLGAGEHVAARRVGDDHQRGGRVWHAGGGVAHRRPRRRRRRRRERAGGGCRCATTVGRGDRGPNGAVRARRCATVLSDPAFRARLGRGALRRAGELTWEATAAGDPRRPRGRGRPGAGSAPAGSDGARRSG